MLIALSTLEHAPAHPLEMQRRRTAVGDSTETRSSQFELSSFLPSFLSDNHLLHSEPSRSREYKPSYQVTHLSVFLAHYLFFFSLSSPVFNQRCQLPPLLRFVFLTTSSTRSQVPPRLLPNSETQQQSSFSTSLSRKRRCVGLECEFPSRELDF